MSLWRYLKLFRKDILSAQPARLYRAWMAEFKTPFFRSFLINDPSLIEEVLKARPQDFPKSDRVNAGLRPLLGESVFVTNGAVWERQRRIIDPSFEGGRLKETFGAIQEAARAATARMPLGETEVEFQASHAAADVIFRTLFSIPIDAPIAAEVFDEFRAYQRSQPLINLRAFLPIPGWMPRFFSKETRRSAKRIRELITRLVDERAEAIAAGTAPDDLATKIMTTPDPETGACFAPAEMVDQVAIFFLAGHETSASALSWALYLLALYPDWQDRVAAEAAAWDGSFSGLSTLKDTRAVFRETLRLYPPVPMMVREAVQEERFRDRRVRKGAQIVVSPWHLHRQNRLWDNPDGFDPARWETENGAKCQREAYVPFSAGRRVCPGAGFAMVEGVVLLASLLKPLRFDVVEGRDPVPVGHLTVRAQEGITLRVESRLKV